MGKDKKEKKVAKQRQIGKAYFFGGVCLLFALVLGTLFFKGYGLEMASANPDYICTKSIPTSQQACYLDTSTCTDWGADLNTIVDSQIKAKIEQNEKIVDGNKLVSNIRICKGKQYTEVYYMNLRTSCESGYINRGSAGDILGDSGRHTSDSMYSGSAISCIIIQDDSLPPDWRGADKSVN